MSCNEPVWRQPLVSCTYLCYPTPLLLQNDIWAAGAISASYAAGLLGLEPMRRNAWSAWELHRWWGAELMHVVAACQSLAAKKRPTAAALLAKVEELLQRKKCEVGGSIVLGCGWGVAGVWLALPAERSTDHDSSYDLPACRCLPCWKTCSCQPTSWRPSRAVSRWTWASSRCLSSAPGPCCASASGRSRWIPSTRSRSAVD